MNAAIFPRRCTVIAPRRFNSRNTFGNCACASVTFTVDSIPNLRITLSSSPQLKKLFTKQACCANPRPLYASGMPALTIQLKSSQDQSAFNLQRWAELQDDPLLANIEGRI